jgi:type IV secretory pathway VirB2 component (pilin)
VSEANSHDHFPGAVNEPEQQPRFLTMIGVVALVVAVVILVFFGIGYLFGRVFL